VKVIIDTNVFISGIFFSGPPSQILRAWRDKKIQLAISLEIFHEYERVGEILAGDHPGLDLKPFLDYVFLFAEFYEAPLLPASICEDPDDDKFFACALACESKVIISGDKHLLKVSGYQNIEVLKPREFVNRYQL